jgi:hypothetical protein
VSCTVNWDGDSSYLASGLGGAVAPPAVDQFNDDTFGVTCANFVGDEANTQVTVYRMAHAVGGPRKARYLLASAADAAVCARKIAADKSCAPYVRTGRSRAHINEGGIRFDNPNSCRCNQGHDYDWF